MRLAALILIASLNLFACGQSNALTSSGSPYDNPGIYFSTVNTLSLEVAYEPGAEPYTGNGLGTGNLWDFVEKNIQALFEGRQTPVQVHVPTDLSKMTLLPKQGKTSWTAEELLNFGVANRRALSNAGSAQFYIVFLNGYYNDGSVNQSVIGARVTGTSIIAIFKPVVTASAIAESMDVAKYVEQSTLTHEMGHALGLVNLGIPTTSDHEDSSHPGHCTNPNCVMYYLNHEGVGSLNNLVKKVLQTGDTVIFGPECLADARGFHPS